MNTIQSRLENLRRARFFLWVLVVLPLIVVSTGDRPLAAQQSTVTRGTEAGVWVGMLEPDHGRAPIEVGFDVTLGYNLFGLIRPQIGLLATDDEAFYGFVGLRCTIPLSSRHFRIDLSTSAGYYERGKGIDLGHDIEFRSGLDLMLTLRKGTHLSVAMYHMSNSSLSEVNPGADTVLLKYVFSLGRRK